MPESDTTITGRWTSIRFLQRAADTGGELLAFEQTLDPGSPPTPEHLHPRQSERFVVERGVMGARLEGREVRLGVGEEITVPAGARHAMWNAGDEPLVTRIELRPALRMEVFFEAIVTLERDGALPRSGPPNLLRVAPVLLAHENWLAGPPIWLQRGLFGALAAVARLLARR